MPHHIRTNCRDTNLPWLFEVSWEVANKVGGIYTVIRTKAPVTVAEYGDRYCLLGPLVHKNASVEVEEMEPTNPTIKTILHLLQDQGVYAMFGKWLIEGSPYVLLFDLNSAYWRLSEWRGDFWNQISIEIPETDKESNDAILFGYLVAWFLGEFAYRERDVAILTHCHEWLASVALVLIKRRQLDIATVFTTHATLLGRYLCAGNVDFYNNLKWFDVDVESGKRAIYHRYCLERAATHCANAFTTVSHITAFEAEHILKRKPDGVLPNGLNVVKFSAMHEFQNLHNENKLKIHSFSEGHFYGYVDFDMDNVLYFFTAGRYEFRNKGVDLYLEALARLNQRLKHVNSPMTVIAFIIMPAATQNYNVDALKGQALNKQLKDAVNKITEGIGKRIFDSVVRGSIPNPKELLHEGDTIKLKRHILSLKRDTLPPIVTHNMMDNNADPVLLELRRLQLFNSPQDRVKIVYHPEFLNSNNPVLGIDYSDFVRGCHLGVFPSYYEPWGYTPAECTLMGVPSVTTNLSGFGCYIEENVERPSDYGIYIVDRRMKSVEESVQQLTEYFVQFCQKSRRQRINLRNRTERLSDLLDWKRVGIEYCKARKLALLRKYPEEMSAASANHTEFPTFAPFPRPLSARPPEDKLSAPISPPTSVETNNDDKGIPEDDAKVNSISIGQFPLWIDPATSI